MNFLLYHPHLLSMGNYFGLTFLWLFAYLGLRLKMTIILNERKNCSNNISKSHRIINTFLYYSFFKKFFSFGMIYCKSLFRSIVCPKYLFQEDFELSEKTFSGNTLYTFKCKKSSFQNSAHVFYIHGGAFRVGLNYSTWRVLVKKILSCLSVRDYNMVFHVFDYPTSEFSSAVDCVGRTKESYIFAYSFKKPNDKFVLMGDSAGGSLSLSILSSLYHGGWAYPFFPDKLILMSPWLDLSLNDGQINKDLDSSDPLLSHSFLETSAELYLGMKNNDFKVLNDPVFDFISSFQMDVLLDGRICIFTSTNDYIHADSLRFAKRISDNGGRITLYIYENLIHDWYFLPIPEASQAFEEINEFINK